MIKVLYYEYNECKKYQILCNVEIVKGLPNFDLKNGSVG